MDINGHRLAVEHVLDMMAAGDSPEIILQGFDWLEYEDIRACLVFAPKLVANEQVRHLQFGNNKPITKRRKLSKQEQS